MAWADGGWDAIRQAGLATGCYPVDIDRRRRPGAAEAEVDLAFGPLLPRLRELKKKVDPTNLFRGSWPLLSE